MNKTALFFLLSAFLVCWPGYAAWEQPIKIAGPEAGDYYDVTSVRFNSQGQVFVVYKAGNQIHLSRYDKSGVSLMKNVSDSKLLCYSPFMCITPDDELHVIWAECSSYSSNTQYVKYRSFNGSWSPVITLSTLDIPGTLPGGYTTRKIESMRMAMDSRKNLFIVLQKNPETKSVLISRYGTQTIVEGWVVTERHKFPDVAADDGSIHVVWQAKLQGADGYTIKYAKKVNERYGRWGSPIDVKYGQNLENSSHSPRITLDGGNRPNLIYMDDDPAGKGRNIYYRYWTGSRFSDRFKISDNGKGYYSNLAIRIVSSGDAIVVDHLGVGMKCNWRFDGTWDGHETISPMVQLPDNESADLTRDGKIAAVACSSDRDTIYLLLSGPTGPSNNLPPTAWFTRSPASGPAPLKVSFNASASTDADGQIVSYHWDFGDGSTGSGVTAEHTYTVKNRCQVTLSVTDNGGASDSVTGYVDVLDPNRPPVAGFTHAPMTGYTPLKVAFAANKSSDSDGRIVRYTWDFGDGKIGYGSTAKHLYTEKKLHKVVLTVTDDDGATDTSAGYVRVVNRVPSAKISFTPVIGLYPLSVSFSASGSEDLDGRIAGYSWDFGDGSRGTGASPTHVYQKKGRFKISLTVTDDDGATAKASGEVEAFALNPPLEVRFSRQANRNLFSTEYLYSVSWKPNPRNEEIGARVAFYKIYRRLLGSGSAFALLYTFPATAQDRFEYIDRTLGNTPFDYEYRISSLDDTGRESDTGGTPTGAPGSGIL